MLMLQQKHILNRDTAQQCTASNDCTLPTFEVLLQEQGNGAPIVDNDTRAGILCEREVSHTKVLLVSQCYSSGTEADTFGCASVLVLHAFRNIQDWHLQEPF